MKRRDTLALGATLALPALHTQAAAPATAPAKAPAA